MSMGGVRRMGTALAAAATGVLLAAAPAIAKDYAGQAYNVLPPGESGAFPPTPNSTDQAAMYDGLTPLFGNVGLSDIKRRFKPNVFGMAGQGPTRSERTPRGSRVKIVRDRFGVAHITTSTRDDLMYGAGWVSAADRSRIMELLRGPARLAALDVRGAASTVRQLAQTGGTFVPSPATEAFMADQTKVLLSFGERGRRVLRYIDQYVAGINESYRENGLTYAPWTRNDVYAMVALLAGVFGEGGGDEARRSQLLDGLRDRLGPDRGWDAWNDLREQYDAETDVSVGGRFPYGRTIRQGGPGNAVIDSGSFSDNPLGLPLPPLNQLIDVPGPSASNALLVSAARSRSGHPLFVAGPQVGYFYPQILMEMDLHGGGIDARGVGVPGFAIALVIGRGKDFSWSLTSAGNDLVDEYVETLCGTDLTYLYKGQCRPMDVLNAGTIEGNPTDPTTAAVTVRSTVHGPVVGYATVNGRRVAISRKRSTRGREVASALPVEDLMTNQVRSADDFRRTVARGFEVTFNFFYADDREIAMVSTGRLPVRPAGVDTGLPTIGDGRFEWQGFIPPEQHPQQTRKDGVILNWNNKPAHGWTAADDVWHYGSVVRNELFRAGIAATRKHTLPSVVSVMNRAATTDLRNDQLLPVIDAVLRTGPAPSARAQRMLELLRAWRTRGSSRLDRDLDGKIDDPGAAVMDVAYPRLADAVMSPVLGPQLDELDSLNPRSNDANNQGSSYNAGWYSYIDKDLRTLLGQRPGSPFALRYCGNGDLPACRGSLWAALDAAGGQGQSRYGSADPAQWHGDATAERIRFLPGLLPRTMRWTNRPTFQQVLEFTGHRGQAAAPRRTPAARRRGTARRRPPSFTG